MYWKMVELVAFCLIAVRTPNFFDSAIYFKMHRTMRKLQMLLQNSGCRLPLELAPNNPVRWVKAREQWINELISELHGPYPTE